MDSCIDCKYFRTDCEFSKTASALESVQCGQFESSDKVCNLKRRTTWDKYTYVCNITEFIDSLCKVGCNRLYRSYLYDCRDSNDNAFAIRLPGRTYGYIKLNKNDRIVKIHVEEGKMYEEGTNEILQKFLGTQLKYI